jgi:hypothetical protein
VKEVSDLICVLAMFSIRTAFYRKALIYANCGYLLFPDDIRFLELHVYTLVLSEDYQSAEEILSGTTASTANLEFLRARVSIMLEMPNTVRSMRTRKFLNYWNTAR